MLYKNKNPSIITQMVSNEPTKGGKHAKQAVSPGISNCIWPETASSETPVDSSPYVNFHEKSKGGKTRNLTSCALFQERYYLQATIQNKTSSPKI